MRGRRTHLRGVCSRIRPGDGGSVGPIRFAPALQRAQHLTGLPLGHTVDRRIVGVAL